MQNRLNRTRNVFMSRKAAWKSGQYSTKPKLKIHQSCVLSTHLCGVRVLTNAGAGHVRVVLLTLNKEGERLHHKNCSALDPGGGGKERPTKDSMLNADLWSQS